MVKGCQGQRHVVRAVAWVSQDTYLAIKLPGLVVVADDERAFDGCVNICKIDGLLQFEYASWRG